MIRLRDWRRRLTTWASQQVGLPFVWGETDCASLVRSALTEMYGADVFPHLPKWTTAREALAVLQAHGSVEAILLNAGAELVTMPFIRAGDIVVLPDQEDRVSCIVCVDGLACITASSRQGVIQIPRPPVVDNPRCVYTVWEISNGE